MFAYVNEYLRRSWLLCVLAKSIDQGRHRRAPPEHSASLSLHAGSYFVCIKFFPLFSCVASSVPHSMFLLVSWIAGPLPLVTYPPRSCCHPAAHFSFISCVVPFLLSFAPLLLLVFHCLLLLPISCVAVHCNHTTHAVVWYLVCPCC